MLPLSLFLIDSQSLTYVSYSLLLKIYDGNIFKREICEKADCLFYNLEF